MPNEKRVKIDDHNADVYHDFPYKKHWQVIMDDNGSKGTVIDAEWVGTDAPASHYTITYWVKSNADGSITEMTLAKILDLNRER